MADGELVLDVVNGGTFVKKAADPTISPAYALPADFAAQYPNVLDTTEIIAMCEEITVWQAIPEIKTSLKTEQWREMDVLTLTSGSAYIAFGDGLCPEEYRHDGDNRYVDLKNIGVKKTLGVSDIMDSAAKAAANWNAINRLLGAAPTGEGVPGASQIGTFLQEHVANLKEKEVRLGTTLVINQWDRLLVQGDATARPLEFDGIENIWDNADCVGEHTNIGQSSATGTFSATNFNNFVNESCVKPTHILGHGMAIQELLMGFFQLGFNGSQIVNFNSGNRLVPGFNFAGQVNTTVGLLTVVADSNFARVDVGGGNFTSILYLLRMTHNGEPLVYKITQIPLAYQDLTPGCTTIAFEIWAKTALVIKWCCAHGLYQALWAGRIATTCTAIG